MPCLPAALLKKKLKGSWSRALFCQNVYFKMTVKYHSLMKISANIWQKMHLFSSSHILQASRDKLWRYLNTSQCCQEYSETKQDLMLLSYFQQKIFYRKMNIALRKGCRTGCNKHLNDAVYEYLSNLCLRGSLVKTEERWVRWFNCWVFCQEYQQIWQRCDYLSKTVNILLELHKNSQKHK